MWNDNWIPSNVSMKLLVKLNSGRAAVVADLMKENGREWDSEILRENLIPMDMEVVLKIPLSRYNMEDVNAWAYERSGVYSLRSTYKLLKDIQMADADHVEGNSLISGGPGLWWKHLWKMKVPPKVRIFWWRAIHNFLPANAVLKHRHIAENSLCLDCGHPVETNFHTMFECTYAIRFWECIKNITDVKPPKFHPSTWAKDLLIGKMCSEDDATLIATCCLSLWTGRNNRNHGKERWSALAAAKFVSQMVEDVLNLHKKKKRRRGFLINGIHHQQDYLSSILTELLMENLCMELLRQLSGTPMAHC
jgi:hypothetical protein